MKKSGRNKTGEWEVGDNVQSIKTAVTDIMGRLSSLQDSTGNPLFLYVRVFNDHFNRMEHQQIEAFPLPCALVEAVSPIVFLPIGGGLQQADVTWRIHIGMEQLDAQDGTMEQNLDIFDKYRDPVVAILSNFRPTACGLLFRTGEQPDYNHTNVYVYTIDFKCGLIDTKGSPYDPGNSQYTYTTPPIDLEIDNEQEQ